MDPKCPITKRWLRLTNLTCKPSSIKSCDRIQTSERRIKLYTTENSKVVFRDRWLRPGELQQRFRYSYDSTLTHNRIYITSCGQQEKTASTKRFVSHVWSKIRRVKVYSSTFDGNVSCEFIVSISIRRDGKAVSKHEVTES